MTNWDDLVEPARGALEALLRKGDEMADRIDKLEAKLEQAVRALRFIGCEENDEGRHARNILAELEENK